MFEPFYTQVAGLIKIVEAYTRAYAEGESVYQKKKEDGQAALLSEVNEAEACYKQKKASIEQYVAEVLSLLQQYLQSLESYIASIQDKGYQKFVRRKDGTQESHVGAQVAEISSSNSQFEQLTTSYEKLKSAVGDLNDSKVPVPVANVLGSIFRKFRVKKYNEIYEARKNAEDLIVEGRNNIEQVAASSLEVARSELITRLEDIQRRKNVLTVELEQEKKQYFNNLKLTTLNALENYRNRNQYLANLANYVKRMVNREIIEEGHVYCGNTFCPINISDDGFMKEALAAVFPNAYKKEKEGIIFPVLEDFRVKKPILFHVAENNFNSCSILSLFVKNFFVEFVNECGVELILADVENMGGKFSEFSPYEDTSSRAVTICRSKEQLKSIIDALAEDIIVTSAKCLKDHYETVFDYNKEATIKKKIKIFAINNIQNDIDQSHYDKLLAIMRNGPKCGVIVIGTMSSVGNNPRNVQQQEFVSAVKNLSKTFDLIREDIYIDVQHNSYINISNIYDNIFVERMNAIKDCSAQSRKIIPLLEYVSPKSEWQSISSSNGIELDVGMDETGNIFRLTFDADHAYALISGNPNSGKTSLLHNIVVQTVTKYSPDEVELYIADLKKGADFSIYAEKRVKSVKVVLDDDEKEVSLGFLRYLTTEISRRKRVFDKMSQMVGAPIQKYEVFKEHYNSHLEEIDALPRILVIIDEFQSLFENGTETASYMSELVRQGRAFGIYIIMASQRAIDGGVKNSFNTTLKSYFVYRMAFKQPQGTVKGVLMERCVDTGKENSALKIVPTLEKGCAIINSNMGETENDSVTVQCFFANGEELNSICDDIVSIQGEGETILLNSQKDPSDYFAEHLYNNDSPCVCLGVSNLLKNDICVLNSDVIRDNTYISVDVQKENANMLVCGGDYRLHLSVLLSVYLKTLNRHKKKTRFIFISSGSDSLTHKILDNTQNCQMEFYSYEQGVQVISDITNDGYGYTIPTYVFICNPYQYDRYVTQAYSTKKSAEALDMEKLFALSKEGNINVCLFVEDAKKMKSDMSYAFELTPIRIISVGSLASIKSAFSDGIGSTLADSEFNIVRDDVIKAYYFNKATDKMGRFRAFKPEVLLNVIATLSIPSDGEDQSNSFTGLVGN